MIITEFASRKSVYGVVRDLSWEDFVAKLSDPIRTSETLAEYAAMTNEQKTETKDVGGYVAGQFEQGKRNKLRLKSRCVLTIDADCASYSSLDDMQALYDDVAFVVHSTHTSTKENLRLRWLFPLTRPVSSAEYRYLCGVVKTWIGEDSIDETTDQPERLMFWPSVCSDAEYYFYENDGEFIDPDKYLDGVDLSSAPDPTEERQIVTDALIPNGTRDNTLTRLAGVFQQAGLPDELCHEFLLRTNELCCEIPLPDEDVNRIYKSISRKSKGDLVRVQDRDDDYDFGDLGDKLDTDSVAKRKGRYIVSLSASEDGNALRARDIPDVDFIVPDLIPECGLGMIFAPPKTGKSWLAMDIAISVATGTPLLGIDTKQVGTLYLALEDPDKRTKRRMLKVGGTDEDRQDLGLFRHVEASPTTDKGFVETMDVELQKYPWTKLVIIDTLQKIRGNAKRTEGAYQYDYRDVGLLQEYAITRDICIIVVHHTKKAVSADEFLSNASGTNGVSGVMDFGMEIAKKKWEDDDAKLKVTGRDFEGKTYAIHFNRVTSRWENLGEEKTVRENEEDLMYNTDPFVKAIRDNLDRIASETKSSDDPDEKIVWVVSLKDLVDIVQLNYGGSPINNSKSLGNHLKKLEYRLKQKDGITFTASRESDGWSRSFSRPRLV